MVKIYVPLLSAIKTLATEGQRLSLKRGMNDNDVIRLTTKNCKNLAKKGAKALAQGKIIGVPTDTVYGLAADAQNSESVARLYEIKSRDLLKPIAICVSQISSIYTWGKVTVPITLLQEFLPGPFTLVFERTPLLNPTLNPGTQLVGIRIPDAPFIRHLAEFHRGPIALTSANPSSASSTLSPEEFKPLWPLLNLVFDGGKIPDDSVESRAGSTVVDLSSPGYFRIIRRGSAYDRCHQILCDKYDLHEIVDIVVKMLRKVLDRESVVKSNLIKRLIDCVKELQFKIAADTGAPLVNDEATNLLCWILEAVFIHGLKNPFLKSMTSVFSKDNVIPEPSFWEFVLIFCHQEVIVQISKLSFISTDVGRCRSWLRLALNDGLFISYLQMMLSDRTTLKDYYKPSAFLRDPEMCDILKSYLYGVESYDFQLACNSSLLNAWNSGPLSLVGLWTASNPNDSITQGVDVAENMDADVLQVLPSLQSDRNSRLHRLPSFMPQMRPPLLEEEEAIRVILASSKPVYPSDSMPPSRKSSDSVSPPNEAVMFNERENSQQKEIKGMVTNDRDDFKVTVDQRVPDKFPRDISSRKREAQDDLSNTTSISITEPHNFHHESDQSEIPRDILRGNSVETPRNEEKSYMDLLNTYNQNHPMGTPITDSFLDSIFPRSATSLSGGEENRSPTPISPVPVEQLGFEVLSIISSSGHFSEMLPQVNSYLQRIPKEVGMDSQNYRCKFCDRPIGMIYGPAKLCALSGNYFCQECHIDDESVIPARILLNWDFRKWSISKQGKIFLQDIHEQPLFDLTKINHRIYNEVEECEEVRVLRSKLQSIALYLKTCKEPVMNEITKDIWPKEHLYEEVHVYSLADLLSIPNRNLATSLTKLVNYGKTHILSCSVCQLKGFVCEICKDPKVIFPFELETNFKCSACGAVYHSFCMNSKNPCPRCDRWNSSL